MSKYNDLIETLGETTSVGQFFSLATKQLSTQLDTLVERVFRQPNFALKSVVDSLFEHQGPLAERSVKLKLLLGLGVISADIYQDVLAFFEFSLPTPNPSPSFCHPSIVAFAQSLQRIDLGSFHRITKQAATAPEDSLLQQMQQQRQENILRSSLILAVVEMSEQLDVESPL